MYGEIHEFPRVIIDSLARLKAVEEIAEILTSKDFATVQVLGRGTSGNASLFLKYLIEVRMGILVADASPSTTSIYKSPIAMRNNLLIGMSQSGKSTDLVEFARTLDHCRAGRSDWRYSRGHVFANFSFGSGVLRWSPVNSFGAPWRCWAWWSAVF
jgi:fructoselysine-6-P-deglycase FrlB-like protein